MFPMFLYLSGLLCCLRRCFFFFLTWTFSHFKRLSAVQIEIHWSTSPNPIVCVHLCQSLSTSRKRIHNVPCFYLCSCFYQKATCYACLNAYPFGSNLLSSLFIQPIWLCLLPPGMLSFERNKLDKIQELWYLTLSSGSNKLSFLLSDWIQNACQL